MKLDLTGMRSMGRRDLFKGMGVSGLGVAALALTAKSGQLMAQTASSGVVTPYDSVTQIVTAALIAEDLATTFYYNGLVGKVIMDPALAGPGGTATNPNPSDSNPGNVKYLQAALTEEISHANLLRSLLGMSDPGGDPYQTFYFPAGSFDTLSAFTGLLDALENAFIGAYLNAVKEFSVLASQAAAAPGSVMTFTAQQLSYYAQVSASILGIECEHRTLGRVISGTDPANNLAYEQTDGLTSVYNGATSAVAALTPFLTSSTGPAYSFATALANQGSVSIPATGNPPATGPTAAVAKPTVYARSGVAFLDGRPSTGSSGGSVASSMWMQLSGASAMISNPASLATTVSLSAPGTCVFQLLVGDSGGDAQVQIVVHSA